MPSHAPDWLRRWRNTDAEPDETQWYFVDSAAALAWLANYGAIELHPWTSRIPDVDRPTYALIDIDPGPRTAWDDVVLLARVPHRPGAPRGVRRTQGDRPAGRPGVGADR